VKRSTWHLRAGAIVAAWLAALLTVGLIGVFRPVTSWLPVHLLLLGAVSNAILIWSRHFADALLRLPEGTSRRGEAQRLVLFNVGAVAVVAGMVWDSMAAVLVGAAVVAVVAGWHAVVLLVRMRRALPSRFGTTLRYYVAAAALLPVGAALGVAMAPDTLSKTAHAQLALAHVVINLLGWMGLTVVGTLVTLWPTMLHTRVADGAERAARRALPVLLIGLFVAAAGALTGNRLACAAGILAYLTGLAVVGRAVIAESRTRPPTTYATRSVLAAQCWFIGSVAALAIIVGVAPNWQQAADAADRLAAPFLIGFAAQVLLGALSYLVPVVLGGGPTATRATSTALDTAGTLRLAAINVGLVVASLPVPDVARTVSALVVLAGLAAFLSLLLRAVLVEQSMTNTTAETLPRR
jgi:nitrite reductase (NO-forming)